MKRVVSVLGLGLSLLVQAAAAQDAAKPAANLDDLLQRVRERDAVERAEDDRRVADFRSRRAEQQAMLDKARAAKAAAEARSAELEAKFEENEKQIPELEETLRARMGTLGELFGVVRQVAGDTRGILEASLTSAQYPNRGEFLGKLGQSRELPSVKDLEGLWFTLQQEMTETGKAVRFSAPVVSTEGSQDEREVIRIGPFVAFADGKYLQYVSETGKLTELGRQPAARHLSTLTAYAATRDGLAGVAIDPSRGQLLSLLIQTPDMRERVDQGGAVGYVTLALGLLGLLVVVQRLVVLGVVGRKMKAQAHSDQPDTGNPLGRVISAYHENRAADVETLELKLDEAILREVPALERGITLIRVVSVVAPLLGLLGTVTGMIQVFEAITLFGAGDPRLMADGISQALVTTVIGLVVAIPMTLLHSFVSSRSKALVQILEEESVGLIAAHAESAEEPARARVA